MDRKQKTQYFRRLFSCLGCLSLQIKSFSTLDNACLSAASVFFRQKYTHSPCDIITPSIRVYFQMSGTCPEECHTTSGRILDEEESIGPATQAILRLLIKTRQCCRLLDSNRMFSAHCQWRLQLEKCWTNRSSPIIMNNFHFCFSRPTLQINFAITCVCCCIIALCIFYSRSLSSQCHNT